MGKHTQWLKEYREKQIKNNLMQAERIKNYSFPSINKKSFPPSFDFTKWNNVKIAVIGSSGSGKSTFIGTLERIFRGVQKFQLPSKQNERGEGTLILQEIFRSFHGVF